MFTCTIITYHTALLVIQCTTTTLYTLSKLYDVSFGFVPPPHPFICTSVLLHFWSLKGECDQVNSRPSEFASLACYYIVRYTIPTEPDYTNIKTFMSHQSRLTIFKIMTFICTECLELCKDNKQICKIVYIV